MELILGVNKGSVTNIPVDDNGTVREVDGAIVCSASPEGVVHLEPSPDGNTCDVIPVGVGTAIYKARADANLTSSVVDIESLDITITVTAPGVQMATRIDVVEGPVVPEDGQIPQPPVIQPLGGASKGKGVKIGVDAQGRPVYK